MGIWSKIFGDPNLKIIKSLQPIIDKINALEPEYQAKSLEDLKTQTNLFKERLKDLKSPEEEQAALNDILPEAFANIREVSYQF